MGNHGNHIESGRLPSYVFLMPDAVGRRFGVSWRRLPNHSIGYEIDDLAEMLERHLSAIAAVLPAMVQIKFRPTVRNRGSCRSGEWSLLVVKWAWMYLTSSQPYVVSCGASGTVKIP
jgi:hypothetical protein